MLWDNFWANCIKMYLRVLMLNSVRLNSALSAQVITEDNGVVDPWLVWLILGLGPKVFDTAIVLVVQSIHRAVFLNWRVAECAVKKKKIMSDR